LLNISGGFPNFFLFRNVQIAGVAAICWTIWKLRNRACFEGKLIQTPVELIYFAVVFMKYWAGLERFYCYSISSVNTDQTA
jgi:hypothetical protein